MQDPDLDFLGADEPAGDGQAGLPKVKGHPHPLPPQNDQPPKSKKHSHPPRRHGHN